MEFRYVNNINPLFSKLKVFDVIENVDEFTESAIDFKISPDQSKFMCQIIEETLLNLHYRLKKFPPSGNYTDGLYLWENVYEPYSRLVVHLKATFLSFRFQ